MVKIKIVINCNNAAFEESNNNIEVARILKEVVSELEEYEARDRKLFDLSGNPVGYVELN